MALKIRLGVFDDIMKKWILIIIILGMVSWATYDFLISGNDSGENEMSNTINEEDIGLEVGDIAPDFELETLSGETARLSDYQGQDVMLNFWATWCPPCRAEMPDMEQLYEEEDIEILAVNLLGTETSVEDVDAFIEEYQLTFPILLDDPVEVTEDFEAYTVPTTFMIDKDGRISFKSSGALNHEIMVRELENMQ